jgi:hypothetical protein
MQNTAKEKSTPEELRECVASNLPALQASRATRMPTSTDKYSIKVTRLRAEAQAPSRRSYHLSYCRLVAASSCYPKEHLDTPAMALG